MPLILYSGAYHAILIMTLEDRVANYIVRLLPPPIS